MKKIFGYSFGTLIMMLWCNIPSEGKSEIIETPDSCYIVHNSIEFGGELEVDYSIPEWKPRNRYKFNSSISVLATKYNAVASQCDSNPLITADNSEINLHKLNTYQLRWIAVSRDLLSVFRYGDKVYVECDNPRIRGIWTIHDTMNERWNKRIDLLVPIKDNYQFNRPMNVKIRKIS